MGEVSFKYIKEIYQQMAGCTDGFYLAGGTALAMHYFQHRESYDLDFFTQDFSQKRAEACVAALQSKIKGTVTLEQQQMGDDFAKMMVYKVALADNHFCKLDFVEDVMPLKSPLKRIDGIDVLSIEDIYMRKIYAISGSVQQQSMTGKDMMIGGRQEAKDFYDIYILSQTFMPLSEFVKAVGAKPFIIEGIDQWFRSFDRRDMQTGLLDLITAQQPDYRVIQDHLEEQINLIIRQQLGDI